MAWWGVFSGIRNERCEAKNAQLTGPWDRLAFDTFQTKNFAYNVSIFPCSSSFVQYSVKCPTHISISASGNCACPTSIYAFFLFCSSCNVSMIFPFKLAYTRFSATVLPVMTTALRQKSPIRPMRLTSSKIG